ncbi:hypothetical protein [Nonomuraea sp. NPDC049709]
MTEAAYVRMIRATTVTRASAVPARRAETPQLTADRTRPAPDR